MSVSIIIPTRNQHEMLDRAIRSIAAAVVSQKACSQPQNTARSSVARGIEPDILVLDNRSDNPASQQYIKDLPAMAADIGLANLSVLSFDEPFNYARMNNVGVRHTEGDVVCLLNNDVEIISPNWLETLVKEVAQPNIGCAGALLFYPDDTVQHAGVVIGMDTIAGHAYTGLPRKNTQENPYFKQSQFCSAVTGACLAIRREVFLEVNGFDEALSIAFNDIDLCLKVSAAGYKNRWLADVKLYHHESVSRGKGHRNQAQRQQHDAAIHYMREKWGETVRTDPHWQVQRYSLISSLFLSLSGRAEKSVASIKIRWKWGFIPRVSAYVYKTLD